MWLLNKDLKEMRQLRRWLSRERAFQVNRRAGAKALRWEHACSRNSKRSQCDWSRVNDGKGGRMWSFNLSCVSVESFTSDTYWGVLLTSIYSKDHGFQIIFKVVEHFLQMKLEMEVQNRKKKSRGGAVCQIPLIPSRPHSGSRQHHGGRCFPHSSGANHHSRMIVWYSA